MSDYTPYQLDLLFRGSWLMEQKVRTELEFYASREKEKDTPPSISHTGLVTIDGQDYKFEFRMVRLGPNRDNIRDIKVQILRNPEEES